MSSIVVSGDTSGAVTLSAPAVAGTVTVTLPSASGTMASLASVTNNGVAYVNSSGQPTSGSALKFDGTALAIGSVTPSTWMLDVKSAGTGVVTNGIRFNRSSVTTQYGVLNYESGQFNNVVVNTAGTGCFWGVLYSSDGSTTTQPLTLDASGNLGLGVTPSAWNSNRKVVQINRASLVGTDGNETNLGSNYYWDGSANRYIASTNATLYNQGAGAHIWYTSSSGTAGNAITFTQAMTLDASGRLGIGATSPGQKFHVDSTANSSAWAKISNGDSGTGAAAGVLIGTDQGDAGALSQNSSNAGYGTSANALRLRNLLSAPLTFETGGSERARIDSSGNLLVGKTTTADTTVGATMMSTGRIGGAMAASTNAQDTLTIYSTGAAAYRFYVGMGGTIYATSTTISAISDARFKENVRDLDAGLSEVMALKPRLYDWKEGKGADIKNARGFIAQEFEEVFPDLIDEWKDPAPEGEDPYKSVRQDLIPVLVKAIQELKAEVDSLKAQINGAS